MSVLIAKDVVREPLYVIVPVQNAWRWKSRYKHTDRALKHFHDSGAVIYLVEAAFNRREAVYADCGIHGTMANCSIIGSDERFRHRYIGLRTASELWLKENLINRAVQELPFDWQQVAWLDSDVHFMRPNWVGECIQQLQHYSFLQMFSQARDLAPNYELLPEDYPHASGSGYIQAWLDGLVKSDDDILQQDLGTISRDLTQLKKKISLGEAEKLAADVQKFEQDLSYYYGPPRVWPGLAWACTRKAWDDVGGLLDFAIWGGGDWHMAHALIGKRQGMMRTDLHDGYKKMVEQWAYRCETQIRRNVGVMDGTIVHHWHGKKQGRGYNTKHSILAKLGFDPQRHLKRDSQGLYQLHDDRSASFVGMRDMMRRVAKERNEDATEV